MTSKVREAAWAAQRKAEEEREAAKLKVAEDLRKKADRELKAKIRKHRHLLDESILPTLFPDAKWNVVNAGTRKDPNTRESVDTLWVREEGEDDRDLTFRINDYGVYLDYEAVSYTYTTPNRWPASVRVTAVEDVGTYLKILSDQLDESWRRSGD